MSLRLGAVCSLVLASTSAAFASDSPKARISDDLIDKHQAWREPGFRLALSFGYETNLASPPTPASTSWVPSLHVGWRLTDRFSLSSTLRYSVMGGSLSGLRFSGTLEPTWHITDGFAVTGGLGYGVLMGSRTDYYTEITDNAVLSACDDGALVALARVTYLFRVGHLFATGPALQLDSQWTSCTDTYESYEWYGDEERVTEVALQDWWWHKTIGVLWVFAWR